MKWLFVDRDVVIAIHDQQIDAHGGAGGIRDMGLIESALSRPENLTIYGDPDVYDLAAEYGFGLARNHGFTDGNKRTAYVVTRLFLRLNGYDITASATDRVLVFESLGKGKLSVKQFASWLRLNGLKLF
jgi:death-on-curing protein